jgi:DNA-binding MarR family transcriptional regulator
MKGLDRKRTPAPLEPDALRVWFRFLRLEKRLHAEMSACLKATGLSIPQFDLLSTLTEREGVSQQELAKRLYVTKGNVSGLVDRLVGMGLVERRALANDRRSHALFLTAKGRSLADKGIAAQRAYVSETLGRLPGADTLNLERAIMAWRDILRARDEAATPKRR